MKRWREKRKKIISLILIMTLILNIGGTVFAATDNDALSTIKLTENRILMKIDDEFGVLTVDETARGAKFTVEVGGEVEGYFNIDKVNNTIYSSYTGKTISIPEIESDIGVMPQAVGDVVESYENKISYADMCDLVTFTSTNLAYAAALITLVSLAMGVTLTAGAAAVVTMIGFIPGAWNDIRNGIGGGSASHGIKVVVDKVEIQKHQGGKIVKGYKFEISSVSLY